MTLIDKMVIASLPKTKLKGGKDSLEGYKLRNKQKRENTQ